MLPGWLIRIIKRLAVVAAGLVILLAIAVGAFRLLLPQLPAYQEEIQQWSARNLGVKLSFDQLDARWGLQGPQLTFYSASVGAAEPEGLEYLSVEEASLHLSIMDLILRQEVVVNRLTLSGTALEVVRQADGGWLIQGIELPQGEGGGIDLNIVPGFEVVVESAALTYIDHAGGGPWRFTDLELTFNREVDSLGLAVTSALPDELGREFALAAEVPLEPGAIRFDPNTADWRIYADVKAASLPGWGRLLPLGAPVAESGAGDLSLWLEVTDRKPVKGTAQIDFEQVVMPGQPGSVNNAAPFDQLAFQAEWTSSEEGWRVVVSDVEIERQARNWPTTELDLTFQDGPSGLQRLAFEADFLRLEDLSLLVAGLPEALVEERWRGLDVSGDVSGLKLAVDRQETGQLIFAVEGSGAGIGLESIAGWPGARGLSGKLRADSATGRFELDGSGATLSWPGVLPDAVTLDTLSGVVVWRQSRDGLRFVGDDISIGNLDFAARSSFELTLPEAEASPILELDAGIAGFDLGRAKRYLPSGLMKPGLVRWLNQAFETGEVRQARVTFSGPLESFPFDNGEGQFSVKAELASTTLRYVPSWPAAEEIGGEVVFDNASLRANLSQGRILGQRSRGTTIRIRDLREPVLEVDTNLRGPLADVFTFLTDAPLIAERLGPRLQDFEVQQGLASVDLDLDLPILRRERFELTADVDVEQGILRIAGLAPSFEALEGGLRWTDGSLTGEGLRGEFLGGPMQFNVGKSESTGYHTRIAGRGTAMAAPLASAFPIPVIDELEGRAAYQVTVDVPFGSNALAPFRVELRSDLIGMGLGLPPPLDKTIAASAALDMALTWVPSGLEVVGRFDEDRAFALALDRGDQGLEFSRGVLTLGGDRARLPPRGDGLAIVGTIDALVLDDWLALSDSQREGAVSAFLRSTDLEIDEFAAFGQALGPTQIMLDRSAKDWLVQVESERVAGSLFVPIASGARAQIRLDMDRLRIATDEDDEEDLIDPTKLPALSIRAADFAVGERNFGALEANVDAVPAGLVLTAFTTNHASFDLRGQGSWLNENGEAIVSRLRFDLASGDVATALPTLGFDPFLEALSGSVAADVYWPGQPGSGWVNGIGGTVTVTATDGSLSEIEPGAGRVFGLMSVAALPRRLALDFRDVFAKGLRFDSLAGDFRLIGGNAYTTNLKLDGPVADIGIVGRAGFAARDYQQQAIVTAEVGKTLPAVGGILAGPGVGAALLLFTEIFKEPLKGIGRASYCVSGSWDEPAVEQISPQDVDEGRLCADLPPDEPLAAT